MPEHSTLVATAQQLEHIGLIAARQVESGQRVGLGSGRAAQAFVRMLGERVHRDGLRIVGIPTSEATATVAASCGVPLGTLDEITSLDIGVDGADEVDPDLNLLKGGGGDLLREKVIASMAVRWVIVIGEEKLVPHLGARFPVFIEVIPFALPAVTRAVTAMGAVVETRRRPDGGIYLTDNGNPIIHAVFGPPPHYLKNPTELNQRLHHIPGIVDTGIFLRMAHEVIVAKFDGTVDHRKR